MRSKSKSILSLCAFLAIAIGNATSTSTSPIIDLPIKDSFSLDHEHHWVVIQNKDKREFLLRTEDGGVHWTSSAIPFNIWQLFFADASEGWGIAAERHGEFFDKFCIHTTDAGQTWQRLGAIAAGREGPTGIAFDSTQHGWIVGQGVDEEEGATGIALVMETNDGGMHWIRQNLKAQPASALDGVRIYNGQVLAWSWGAGGSGIFELRSGALPRKIFDGETMDLASFANGPLYALTQSSFYSRTAGSDDWEETDQSFDEVFRTSAFVDPQHGCIAGTEMYCTQDGGHTWTKHTLPKIGRNHDPIQVFRLCMIGEDIIWAVSEDTVYESAASGSWTKVAFFDRTGKPLESLRHE